MKATGIVRRIDDLGRIVIPKEIRRTMRIREGEPLEIFTDSGGEVIFKKYSPIGELSNFASGYADTLYRTTGQDVAICDRDSIVAVAGAPKKELFEKRISSDLEKLMDQRQSYSWKKGERPTFITEENDKYKIFVMSPILFDGDVIGAVAFLTSLESQDAGEVEVKLAGATASFLAKHMES